VADETYPQRFTVRCRLCTNVVLSAATWIGDADVAALRAHVAVCPADLDITDRRTAAGTDLGVLLARYDVQRTDA
jgi:hypothetical protein